MNGWMARAHTRQTDRKMVEKQTDQTEGLTNRQTSRAIIIL